ncbi:MAG TPA: hypothetical protein VD863_20375 [Bradyrhizobium sp.]|nr:hypothetical protein [Bradyrhizobium sp.]
MTERLNAEQCLVKESECQELSKLAHDPSHRVMLQHIAETWRRIAQEIKIRAGTS